MVRPHARRRSPIRTFVLSVVGVLLLAGVMSPAELLAAAPAASRSHAEAVLPRVDDGLITRSIPIDGERLSGFVLPIDPVRSDLQLHALRASIWSVDDTQRVALDGEVIVRLGLWEFRSDAAWVWINRMPTADGLVTQIAIYFDRVNDSKRQASTGAAGRELLVTAAIRGEVTLDVALPQRQSPPLSAARRRAESALRSHLQSLTTDPPTLSPRPRVESGDERRRRARPDAPERIDLPQAIDEPTWLLDPEALVTLSADELEFSRGETENIITAHGSIVVEYRARRNDPEGRQPTQLTLTAQRAVIFLRGDALPDLANRQFSADDVLGIYLEGNATVSADRDRYSVRTASVYYDLSTGQAFMVDALLRTTIRDSRRPLHARAAEMRQVASNQWQAQRVRISASEFHTGHLALGAERVSVTQQPRDDEQGGQTETLLDARNITLRGDGVPFFWWPGYRGTIDNIPLRSIDTSIGRDRGFGFGTRWNAFGLMGLDAPDGHDLEARLDWFELRGFGGGLRHRFEQPGLRGSTDLYGLFNDDGTDRTSAGRRVEQDGDFRGIATTEWHARLSTDLTLQLQGATISDPSFVSTWRSGDFATRREYENSAYLKYQKDRMAITGVASYRMDDFISNGWLLASTQYSVDRLPELTFRRYGDSLFGDLLTMHTESRVGRVRIRAERSTARELGVRVGAFEGAGLDDPVIDLLEARGLREYTVTRLDTRHEVSLPFTWQDIRIAPFLVGRVTNYDNAFDEFNPDADWTRFWGAAGVRASTTFQRVYDGVHSRALDLSRLRHVIEPSVAVWHATTNAVEGAYPIYDREVEALAAGTVGRIGVRNTFQTQRGGPGQWRSVDVLVLDTALVKASGEIDRTSPMLRYFEYRPEYSQLGDHAEGSFIWRATNALTFSGFGLWDLDEDSMIATSIAAELRHRGHLTTAVEYRSVEPSDTELISARLAYRMTPTYNIAITPQWDFREDAFRAVTFRILRTFPDFEFGLGVQYDNIRGETSLAATLRMLPF